MQKREDIYMPDNELLVGLEGLECANCAAKIERKVKALPEISDSEVNFMQQSLRVVLGDRSQEKSAVEQIKSIVHSFEPDVKVVKRTAAAVSSTGAYKAEASCNENDGCECQTAFSQDSLLADSEKQDRKIRTLLFELLAGAVIFASAFGLEHWGSVPKAVTIILYLLAYLVLGLPVLIKAGSNIIRGKVFDENFLMAIATIGALAISQWSEAVAVMLFYQVGEYFQSTAVHRSRRSISELLSIRPDYANVQRGDVLMQVSPESVSIGDTVVVKPGEKVPLDGIVLTGSSAVDTSALTGESVFRDVEPGDPILSGCINKQGVLTIQVTASYGESTVSKIIEMVTNAGSRKSKSENLITRFAAVYTPVVVVAALLLAVVPPLFFGGSITVWLYRALSFLVISCPCALVISVPLGYFGGIGAASKRGILVKGSNFLDALYRADTIVFDKTGTLTKGVFSVSKVVPSGKLSETELLGIASVAEAYSDHPIAVSVRMAARMKEIMFFTPDTGAYTEIAGRGVSVHTEETDILVGNRKLMIESGIKGVPDIATVGTLLFVALDKQFAGYLEIADEIKPEAARVISRLRDLHIRSIAMLTGDHDASAQKVAGELGITEVYSGLLPSQKLEKIEELFAGRSAAGVQHKTGSRLAGLLSGFKAKNSQPGMLVYVGDGINDAPVLVRADIGIAIGAMASGAAIEAADIVIMTDDMEALPKAIRIARKTRRIVMENIAFALSVKGLILILAALGLTNLWFAIFADVGVAMIAILNSVRAGR